MSKLLKLTMTDGREVLVSVKAAYDAGPHRVINEDEGCECYAVLETLKEIQALNNVDQELTIRDQFAMSAMTGLLSNSGGVIQANSNSGTGWVNTSAKGTAELAYEIADAMLKAREVRQ